ncbi:hypothetical protein [Mycobacterium sp. IS-1496]|uniref:hypothetical protein n=1 Tax=Mycobacterium sp. IS-1496 TaxID=1772284 RepID=UPI000AA0AD06|nr:hypothetical protein [Mycobacterium sp. IS-1496]
MSEAALGWAVTAVLLAMLAIPFIVGFRRSREKRLERLRRWAGGTGSASEPYGTSETYDSGDCGGGAD